MLLFKLLEMECALKAKSLSDTSQLKAIVSLKTALLEIDFSAEEIPEHSYDKLKNLFEDIIRRKLFDDETAVLKWIIQK